MELPEHVFELFEIAGCENCCLPALNMWLHDRYQEWKTERLQRANPYNFRMTNADMRAIFTFYICPRPVVLVSVEHQGESNIFPMDLIGPTDSPWFSMALRATSPAIRLMQESRRMALASIPLAYKDLAYELGKHHRVASIDWSKLPFRTILSPQFELRIPEAALRVREVRVHEFHEIGSHVLFLTTVDKEAKLESAIEGEAGLPMFHLAGSYSRYRERAAKARS
jgi:flavin reductase (DIM6/NTAB) family NADH-FMN oxidoreductase RutF